MTSNYSYHYSKKQIKDMSSRRERPIVIGIVLEICVPMIIGSVFVILLSIAKKYNIGSLENFVYDWLKPVTITCWTLWVVGWAVLLVYGFYFMNDSESMLHSDAAQNIQINNKQAILTIYSKNGTIQERFYIKRIKRKKHYLIVYKNLHNFVMIPIEVVNHATVKEVYK